MEIEYILSGVLVLFLLSYLIYSIVYPEKF